MKRLGQIAGVVVLLLIAVGLVGAALPRQWRVERSVTIAAPAERIHPFIEDLRRWQEWTVWTANMDPKVKHVYEGAERGVGARWAWNGPEMGRGRMAIVESDPHAGVTIDEAIEQDEINAHSRFTYAEDASGTRVTWVDEGTLPPVIGGYARGFIESMLGDHFSNSLAKLKTAVEALPPPPPAPAPAEPGEAGAPDAGAAGPPGPG